MFNVESNQWTVRMSRPSGQTSILWLSFSIVIIACHSAVVIVIVLFRGPNISLDTNTTQHNHVFFSFSLYLFPFCILFHLFDRCSGHTYQSKRTRANITYQRMKGVKMYHSKLLWSVIVMSVCLVCSHRCVYTVH